MNIVRSITTAAACILAFAPLTATAALPYGPDTCAQGYVWREAYAGDHVCVSPRSRAQAADDNAQASSRIQPGGGPYGPNTCLSGFVWREARSGDQVCVTTDVRTNTAEENRMASQRRAAPEAPSADANRGGGDQRQTRTMCANYAKGAVSQYQAASSRCHVKSDGRWHANYQAHLDWCMTAQPDWRRSEYQARKQYLAKCGSRKIDDGPVLVPADD